jgi:hypothetical protein
MDYVLLNRKRHSAEIGLCVIYDRGFREYITTRIACLDAHAFMKIQQSTAWFRGYPRRRFRDGQWLACTAG